MRPGSSNDVEAHATPPPLVATASAQVKGSGSVRVSDIGVSGALAAMGILATALSWRMENPLEQPIGPGYVPALVSACLAVLALGQTVRAWRTPQDAMGEGKGEVAPDPRRTRTVMTAAALTGGAIWVWSIAGYLAAIILAVSGVMAIDRKVKPGRAVSFAVLLGVSLWLLFHVIFKIDLG